MHFEHITYSNDTEQTFLLQIVLATKQQKLFTEGRRFLNLSLRLMHRILHMPFTIHEAMRTNEHQDI